MKENERTDRASDLLGTVTGALRRESSDAKRGQRIDKRRRNDELNDSAV